MFIRTERLFLRPIWPEDMDELLELVKGDAAARNLADVPPEDVEEARSYLMEPHESLLPHFFINLRGSTGSRLIGSIGLGRPGSDVELGYWIARQFRGRGYAAEAVRAVLMQARLLGHRRILASHFADNDTADVLESVGFSDTGAIQRRYSPGQHRHAPARIFAANLDRLGPERTVAVARSLA